ncbi:unnamed protein product, partial [marine sediment metagenome]
LKNMLPFPPFLKLKMIFIPYGLFADISNNFKRK